MINDLVVKMYEMQRSDRLAKVINSNKDHPKRERLKIDVSNK